MLLDLVCPSCLHDAGRVEFDTARGACPGCNIALMVGTNVMPVEGFADPPARQLARRVATPPHTKVRMRSDGDRLVTWVTSWLLAPFMKRILLGPEGVSRSTWSRSISRGSPTWCGAGRTGSTRCSCTRSWRTARTTARC